MTETQLAEALGAFPTGNLCNAHPDVKAMGPALAPLFKGIKICGPAKTARVTPGQNAAIHRAVHMARPGEILVVDGGGSCGFGPFGDILATACRLKGIGGLVIDSTIRDTAEIRQMGFPVFCRGANPTATAKSDPGEIDGEVCCAGVPVRPGDIIVADDDGVVVVPHDVAEEIAEKAAAVARREQVILDRLAKGETTYQIFDLATHISSQDR
ncbi:MAG: RraA family protein [Pseudomonadota bacterium]